jgi:hypothetical protein
MYSKQCVIPLLPSYTRGEHDDWCWVGISELKVTLDTNNRLKYAKMPPGEFVNLGSSPCALFVICRDITQDHGNRKYHRLYSEQCFLRLGHSHKVGQGDVPLLRDENVGKTDNHKSSLLFSLNFSISTLVRHVKRSKGYMITCVSVGGFRRQVRVRCGLQSTKSNSN